ncbi:PepSY-like domain-containing protein [Bacteroides sp. 51]|uniref:PepSY-like domain-containing protein n=1 Tax=Bacteroides sp. 51 TaxID=2302938 RepID=UPI0013D40A80|nr:PepSY-like domain-containing protein [Bacteroides sp. 51]NDV83966.1 hypothetical protein [Bacteroides sp. 51]
MKKILSLVVMALIAIQFTSAKDVVTKDEMQLPLAARNFINQHFTKPQISYIKIESELLKGKKYEAVLTSGVEIEFDSKGEWTDVDCKRGTVPASIIPEYVKEYVKTNFSGQTITQIERDRHGIEVELNNDLSIKFDKKGQLRELDD